MCERDEGDDAWLFTEETLLFGSRPVHLRQVPLPSSPQQQGRLRWWQRGTRLRFGAVPGRVVDREPMPLGYERLVLPAIPGSPVSAAEEEDDDDENAAAVSRLLLLSAAGAPLIKCDGSSSSSLHLRAVQSGRRSAVLRVEDASASASAAGGSCWVRLKGCGDLCDGFPLAPAPQPGCVQLRGCTFAATAAREAAMTRAAAAALRAHGGLRGANDPPLGWWVYPRDPAAPFPDVPRCCGLFVTRGDRRLLTHVVAGLDEFLSLLPPPPELLQLQQQRFADSMPTPMVCLLADPPLSASLFADCSSIAIPVAEASLPLPSHVDARWMPLWTRLAAEVVGSKEAPLGYIFARLGFETGRVLNALQTERISWGTYRDALATHCNAHPNNLVLVLDEQQWLAPLDFDMAFAEKHYAGGQDFGAMLELERGAMALSLAGDDEANSGASSSPFPLPETHSTLRWALRDTMVRWFLQACDGGCSVSMPTIAGSAERTARALLQLALILSSGCIA